MTRKTPEQELTAVLDAVRGFPAGASTEDIVQALPDRPARRTLQRWLALLVSQGRLVRTGKGPATRYSISTGPVVGGFSYAVGGNPGTAAHPSVSWHRAWGGVGEEDFYPPVSLEGEAVRTAVRRPLQARTPVGYCREFLDAYQPNRTFYLPEELRARLRQLGSGGDGARPAGTYARQILNRLLIDLSWNSSRLEGNTYSLLETERLLQFGAAAEGKDALETQMLLNHKAAIELLVEDANEIRFNRYTILNLHSVLSENLLIDPLAGGRLRTIAVGIGGSVYEPLSVPQQIDDCFQQVLDTASEIIDPLEQAFFSMVHLPYLQPFEDVNKRVSRLAANIPLIRENMSPLSFVDVPENAYVEAMLGVYELNRIELLRDVFVWACERSCARYSAVRKTLGQPDPFRLYYRQQIGDMVREVVLMPCDKLVAPDLIRTRAAALVLPQDVSRFIELVETELLSLHEGNLARFRLRPSQYEAWKKVWD